MYQQIIIVGNLGKDPEMRYTPSGTPVTSMRAATAEPRVPPVEYPAAEAVDCMQLFSSNDIWLSRLPERKRSPFQTT